MTTSLGYFSLFPEKKIGVSKCAFKTPDSRVSFCQFRAFPSRLRPLFFVAFFFFLHHGNFFSRVVYVADLSCDYHQPPIRFRSDVGTSCITFRYPGSSFSVPPLEPSSWDCVGKVERNSAHYFCTTIIVFVLLRGAVTRNAFRLSSSRSSSSLCRVSIRRSKKPKKNRECPKPTFWCCHLGFKFCVILHFFSVLLFEPFGISTTINGTKVHIF